MTMNRPIYLRFYYAIRSIPICRSATYAGQGKCALSEIYCTSALSVVFVIKPIASCRKMIGLCFSKVSEMFLQVFYNTRVS